MKIAMIIDDGLEKAMFANAAACMASGLFNEEKDLLGQKIDGENCAFIPITKVPILILRKNNRPFSEFVKRAKKKKLKYMIFTKEAQTTTNYDEYAERVTGKNVKDIEIIGLGVLGEDEAINKFTGDLQLHR
jgi:hypothetical protein